MEKPKITEITAQLVDLLEPFDSTERQRIVQASMLLLGESTIYSKPDKKIDEEIDVVENNFSSHAKIWMKQNHISVEDLQQIFHVADGNAEVITSEMPGKDQKAKTINAYILQGLANLLVSNESKFDDKSARSLCVKSGCYSAANHAVYIKAVGNKLAGSKDVGWTLTSPGLKYGADLIKTLTR
ncbi:hypothetical protein [Ferruginibacter sp.]